MQKRFPTIIPLCLALIGLQLLLIRPAAAQTPSEAPYSGQYYCYTTVLNSDRYANNAIAPRPAPFGKLVLDGKGGYMLTAKRQTGRYAFDARTETLRFTGLLATMQVSDYSPDSFKLNYRSANGTYAFNCVTDGVGDPRAAKKASPDAVQRLVAGRFFGEYMCASRDRVAIELQLTSDDDNNVTGVAIMQPGGKASRHPLARYAVKGRWFKEANFSLRPQDWIDNPENLALPDDWMVGVVEQDALTHIKMSDSCPNFSLKRVR